MLNEYLQKSAQLFKHLTKNPDDESRTEYIEKINQLLDERGELVISLQRTGFKFNPEDEAHHTLYELDKGIKERLALVMDTVKNDIKDLQNTKK